MDKPLLLLSLDTGHRIRLVEMLMASFTVPPSLHNPALSLAGLPQGQQSSSNDHDDRGTVLRAADITTTITTDLIVEILGAGISVLPQSVKRMERMKS